MFNTLSKPRDLHPTVGGPSGANDSLNAKTPTETICDCFSDVNTLQMISIQTLVPAKISFRIKRLNRERLAQHLPEAFTIIYFS